MKKSLFSGDFGWQTPSSNTKHNYQGNLCAIISCQKVLISLRSELQICSETYCELKLSGVPKRGRWEKSANARKRVQMHAKERKRKSAKENKREQKSTKGRKERTESAK